MVDLKEDHAGDPHGAHLHLEVYARILYGTKKYLLACTAGGSVFMKARGIILAEPNGIPQFVLKVLAIAIALGNTVSTLLLVVSEVKCLEITSLCGRQVFPISLSVKLLPPR